MSMEDPPVQLENMQAMCRSLEGGAKPVGLLIITNFGEMAVIVIVILGTVLVNQFSRKCNDLLMFSFPTVTALMKKHFFFTVFGKSAAAVIIIIILVN